ncbi:hypothetical protein R6Q59_002309 [Mikania micrantha]
MGQRQCLRDHIVMCFCNFALGNLTYNMECVLDFLMRDTQHKLLFCWDLSHCTDTGFSTVENRCKRILLKEIRKLWEKKDSNLPWELGEYDESNTLLVENAPCKALLNPPNTAIFPYPYRYWNREDNSLGPKGDLRIYLERLAASENVQKFVSENSFGERPIREKNLSWRYYQKVIHAFSSKHKAGDNSSMDAPCKNSSEPKPDTTVASVTKTLSKPKTDTSTALADPSMLESISTTTSAAHTLVEPETITAIALVDQTLLGPDLETGALAAQTSLESETTTSTILTAPTLLEPETITTALVGQSLSEPDIDTSALATQTSVEPETIITTVFAAAILLEPETGTTTALVGQTLSEPDLDTSALAVQTSLEPENITSFLIAQTLLEPETSTTIDLGGQSLSEPEINTTAAVALTLLKLNPYDA